MIKGSRKAKLFLILILFWGIGFFFLTGCQSQQENTPNPFVGKWVSKGLFFREGFTEEALTNQEKLGITYVNSYFKEGTLIEFLENGTFKIPDLGEGKYEITKDNRLKIMNDIAGIILDFEITDRETYIMTDKMYIKLEKDIAPGTKE